MTTELNYSSIKLARSVRDFEEKRSHDRKKQLLMLIRHYLKGEGYLETARQFEAEAKLNSQYTVCDNIDLLTVLQEYESYFFLRFQKYPKICKKESPTQLDGKQCKKSLSKTISGERSLKEKIKAQSKFGSQNTSVDDYTQGTTEKQKLEVFNNLDLLICPMSICPNENLLDSQRDSEIPKDRVFKPLSTFEGYNEEWRIFAEIIAKEICSDDLNVKWDDIIGLDTAKRLLKESVVYPMKYPDMFKGIVSPWKGLMLYGPPGTGKTLLAKAVATECNTTFFNISASTLVSKWRGDSEKLVRVMFEMARHQAPSTIFVDEIDALASRRASATEHEASRRLKSELLIQLDGLSHSNDRVFFLTTSNLPWELDSAMLRRLEKRILVDVPNEGERTAMFKYYLPRGLLKETFLVSEVETDVLSQCTEGYSGSDIKLVCKEAAMQAMREVISELEKPRHGSGRGKLKFSTITTDDVMQAINSTKPSSANIISKYREWQLEFGST